MNKHKFSTKKPIRFRNLICCKQVALKVQLNDNLPCHFDPDKSRERNLNYPFSIFNYQLILTRTPLL